MKVLLVVHAYAPEGFGGTERYAEALAQALRSRGHEVAVFCGSLEWRQQFEVVRSVQDGIPVTRVHRDDLYFDHWDKVANPKVANAFEDELDRVAPDVVHLQHWLRLSNDLVRRAATHRIPALVHLHDLFTCCPRVFRLRPARSAGAAPDDVEFCHEPFVNESCRPCVPRWKFQGDREIELSLDAYRHAIGEELAAAAGRIALSRNQLAELRRWSPRPELPIEVLSHPWLPGAVDTPIASAQSPAGRLRLLYFSNVAPIKGAHVLLEAMQRLAARAGGSPADPAGGVSLEAFGAFATEAYEKRLRELAAGLDVRFHGRYARNEPRSVAADVAVIPTLAHETWSFWLDEAVTTGLPILASDAGAIGERATGRVKLVPPGDVGALADAIALLRDQPAERLALAAAPAPFIPTLAEHIARLEKLLEEVIHRGAPPLARPTTRPSAEWMHEWQRREIAFGELLRSEGWEDALRWQKSEIERLQKELAARTAAPEKA